jgi:hypothetical protein
VVLLMSSVGTRPWAQRIEELSLTQVLLFEQKRALISTVPGL